MRITPKLTRLPVALSHSDSCVALQVCALRLYLILYPAALVRTSLAYLYLQCRFHTCTQPVKLIVSVDSALPEPT